MNQIVIDVKQLCRSYRSYQRGSSFKEILISIFHRKFSDVIALDQLGFSIRAGELVGFLGPNGAGKSTTIKILSGVLYPTSGEVRCLGLVPWKDRKRYVGQIGAVFGQKSQLIWDIPPLDSFVMNQAIYGIPKAEFQATLNHLAAMLRVEEIMTKPTRNLSLGERMKCEFIMAMLHRPQIVFLDEPTIGLDVIAKETIRDFIKEMNRQGTTFILTTHDLADIEYLANRVIVINHGQKVFDGSLDQLKALFGQRRQIRLQTQNPLGELSLPGLAEISRRGASDLSYELDLAKSSLEDFLSLVGGQGGIKDLEVGELPIESVIKEIYEQSKALTP